MIDSNNMQEVLDSLSTIAVCVIEQDSHKILYYNKTAKKISPEIDLGLYCHDIWFRNCKYCPLLTIGEQHTNTKTCCSGLFSTIVDITATKIIWNRQIPAYVVSITPHIDTPDEQEKELERRQLSMAATQVYPVIVSVNLTQNTYHIIENQLFKTQDIPKKGNFDELLEQKMKILHPDYQMEFARLFSREHLMECFHLKEKSVFMEHLQMGDDGIYHWTASYAIQVDNPYNDDVLEIILSRNIDEQKETEQQLKDLLELTYNNIQGSCAKYILKDHNVFLLEANEQYFELLDTDEREYENGIFPRMESQQRQKYLDIIEEHAKTKEPFFFEFEHQRKNGSSIWLQLQFVYLGERDHHVVYHGIVIDITEKKLLELEHQATFQNLPGGIAKVLLDDRLTLIEANPTYYQIMGYPVNSHLSILDCVYQNDREFFISQIKKQLGTHFSLEHRIQHITGKVLWVHVQGNQIGMMNGKPLFLVVIVDISNQKQLEEMQYRYQELLERSANTLLEYNPNTCQFDVYQQDGQENNVTVVYDYDLIQDKIIYSKRGNQKFDENLLRLAFYGQLKNCNTIDKEDKIVLSSMIARCQKESCSVRGKMRLLLSNGKYEWFDVYMSSIWNENDSQCISLLGKFINIHRIKTELSHWEERAVKDPLTGIYNRAFFEERVNVLLNSDEVKHGALIFIDIDNFKWVNDHMGHTMGDAVLRYIAQQMKQCVRSTDIVARYGGDEFVIFLKNINSMDALIKKLNRLKTLLSDSFFNDELNGHISASIGVALFPEDAKDYQSLLKKADETVYSSKKMGKNQFTFYQENLNKQ